MKQTTLKSRPESFELNTQHPLASGLVFAGLGRVAGSLHCRDSSPYGNHGTLTNMDPATDWVWDGALNRFALDFAASNQHVALNDTGQPTSYTLCAWVKGLPYDGNFYAILVREINSGAYDRTYRLFVGTYNSLSLATRSAGTSYSAVSSVAGEGFYGVSGAWATWHHVAVTWSGTQQFYRNGAAKATTTGSVTAIGNPSPPVNRIGLLSDNGNDLVGQLSDVMVYHRVLTTAEIQQLADPSNVMLSGLILPPRRRLWGISGEAPPVTFKAAWARNTNTLIGGGVG